MKKKIFSLMVAVMCMVATFGFAVSANTSNVSALTNELLAEKTAQGAQSGNRLEYDVTFKLPSTKGTVQKKADVVIVMDKSSVSDLQGLKEATESFVDQMLAKQQADNVEFKVGVVWFNQNVHDGTTGLVALNSTTATTIKNAITDGGGGGTDAYGGLLRAQNWLKADTEVNAGNKFLIYASDMGGYLLDDGNGTGTTRKYYVDNNNDGIVDSVNEGTWNFGFYRYAGNHVFTSNDVNNLINNKVQFNGVTATDTSLSLDPIAGANSKAGYVDTTLEGKTTAEAEAAGYRPNKEYEDPASISNFEKSMYWCGNILKDMKNDGYNLMAVTNYYKLNDPNLVQYCNANKAFQKWFEENIGKRYCLDDGDTTAGAFNDISAQVFDLLGKGQITDEVNTEHFKLTSIDDLRVEVNNAELPSTKINATTVGFGTAENGVYPYVGHYDETNQKIIWDINVKASRYELVEFTHTEKFTGAVPENATEFETNKNATIDYMSSIDVENNVTDFNKQINLKSPTVTIGGAATPAVKHNLTINYVYEDGSKASESYKGTFAENDPYSIKSPAIKGYTASITVVSGKMGTDDVIVKVTYKKVTVNEGKEETVDRVISYNGANGSDANSSRSGVKTDDTANINMYFILFALATFGILAETLNRKTKKDN